MNSDTVLALYKSGALIPAAIIAVYLLLKFASTRFAFLEAPGRAHYVTAAISVLAVLAVPAMQGETPSLAMVLAALGGNIALFLPGKPPSSQTPVKNQTGSAGLLLLLVLAFMAIGASVAMIPSCGPKTVAAEQQFVSCAESAAASDLGPGVQAILQAGSASWEAQLEALAAKFGVQAVTCAVNAAIAALTPTAGSGAVVTAAQSPALDRANVWLKAHGAAK